MGMELIQHYVVPSGGMAGITFDPIAADWKDLYLVVSARTTATSAGLFMQFNGNSSGYSSRTLSGNGSSASSSSNPYNVSTKLFMSTVAGTDQTANTFNNIASLIPNYASGNAKSASTDAVMENNNGFANMDISAGLWTGTAAITSLAITLTSGNITEYSTATLYGII
jgi:hypothetical protein